MKQQGTTWINAEGQQVPSKYVQPYEKIAEKIGQTLAAEAERLEKALFEAKRSFLKAADEMYARHKAKNNDQDVNSFVFYTFDKGYKIEVDRKAKSVRIYRANKPNPKVKDYTIVILEFSSIGIDTAPEVEEATVAPPKERKPLPEVFDNSDVDQELMMLTEQQHAMAEENQSEIVGGGPDGPTDDKEEY